MSRCGCAGSCACSIAPGPGVTVSGNGSATNPYVVSANAATDCEVIQDCVGQGLGPGLEYDDDGNQIRVKISEVAGNAATLASDGGVYAAGGDGSGGLTSVATQDTTCIGLSGLGTAGAPLTADPTLDPAAGNLLSCGSGGLRAGLATSACGLTGDGTTAAPLAARVGEWPYTCPIDDNASGVYCDSAGTLRGEPPGKFFTTSASETTTYANEPVPSGTDTVVVTRTLDVTNPDPCRTAYLIVEEELDVDVIMPGGGSQAAIGMGGDDMIQYNNPHSGAELDNHIQTTKVFSGGTIPPGGTVTISFDVTMGLGTGGATYNRIQTIIRAFVIVP